MTNFTRRAVLALAAILSASTAMSSACAGSRRARYRARQSPRLAREGARIDRHHRPQGHGRDGRRHAHSVRHLPTEERHRESARDLRAHAVQHELLGRQPRRARRHDAAARRGEARLRVGRRQRARTFLLRGQLRHPRPAAHRRRRRDQLDQHAAVVERQGRPDRLFVDRRVADGRRGAGIRRDSARSFRRALAPVSAALVRTTSRATGIAAAPCRCCSSTG